VNNWTSVVFSRWRFRRGCTRLSRSIIRTPPSALEIRARDYLCQSPRTDAGDGRPGVISKAVERQRSFLAPSNGLPEARTPAAPLLYSEMDDTGVSVIAAETLGPRREGRPPTDPDVK
jgi:hypothetical protein